ncbi:MAG: carbonic anhydrase [Pseudomonadota bacterium]|nr:carbonic anhydrase [Pseudomonadota bacterium]
MPYPRFIRGFRRFRKRYMEGKAPLFRDLVKKGQAPETLVIACSDSRNDPALLTQSQPGDLFVVRNVAALVPPYQPDGQYHGTSAAIEFAVRSLGVKNIIVLGHGLCGGIQTLADSSAGTASGYEFLTPWVSICAEARDTVQRELADQPVETRLQTLERAAILTSLNNLLTFPWIREAVEAGHMTLHGWYFDMAKGTLLGYGPATRTFEPLGQNAKALAGIKGLDSCCIASFVKGSAAAA